MYVEPDAAGAVKERTVLLERMREVLDRAGLAAPRGSLGHPAAVDVVHTAQRELRSGPLTPDRRRTLMDALDRLPPPVFGPAEPGGHLSRSVTRALRSIPPRRGANGQPVTLALARWQAAEREVLAETVGLLNRIWPEYADEIRETVMEIALLEGDAINGYTDFTIHGAVLVNRVRLTESATGLSGVVRLAEALVHEGAHTRCNAAAVADPFLQPERLLSSGAPDAPGGSGGLLVTTPLRADPRPLTGLFQQLVVLARSVLLYRRLAGQGSAVDARHAQLLVSAHQAVDTLTAHRQALTPHGRRVLAESAALLESPG
ncbi:aKG-HExxH-type peptide beta-hydroxylase [Streptomyces albipurpureus]|uniref:HEXXH motif-containing putative peptide modification protein n=1 Tax=Streptomyces albipurpureus TaxID=2897419 RepID=A0ABT0UVC1_9ACTN|nr:HEXXH motif-containing putative peptide modification protein [Streptomyces sp. CWNU-1]MCM2392532.1 HEXXH motif-containing putative peptide modification protein [Streptomyces sp. CWNU-1]